MESASDPISVPVTPAEKLTAALNPKKTVAASPPDESNMPAAKRNSKCPVCHKLFEKHADRNAHMAQEHRRRKGKKKNVTKEGGGNEFLTMRKRLIDHLKICKTGTEFKVFLESVQLRNDDLLSISTRVISDLEQNLSRLFSFKIHMYGSALSQLAMRGKQLVK